MIKSIGLIILVSFILIFNSFLSVVMKYSQSPYIAQDICNASFDFIPIALSFSANKTICSFSEIIFEDKSFHFNIVFFLISKGF